MENKAHALAAGAFVIALIGAIIALVLWFTRDNTVRNVYELTTSESVSGLQPQAQVRYRGISVGRVTAIDFDPKVRGNVLVRISVDQRVPLTKSSYAALSYQGVTGLASIAIDDDGTSQVPVEPDNGDPPRIPLRPSAFAKLQERGEAILEKVERTVDELHALMGDDNRQRVSQALENIAQASASANSLTKNLDDAVKNGLTPALKSVPALAQNATTTLSGVRKAAGDVSRVANNLNTTVTRLNAQGGAIERLTTGTEGLAHALDSFSTTTLPRVNRMADDTAQAVRRLGRAADNINQNPQSLLFGSGEVQPGPGESGFEPPPAAATRP
ncbi:MlaD family protein [Variovorax dokdonensis]|uniref:MlaD family protein n=1 Tax=Variovorax dokdonensis TaxID=344883 RepID=A0ABT7NFW5_9BURK|nr:MlaD family protein [Variovorax dokdonensis]MDM0046839.1 MlaD family protein [Variovorax dokdonensis]